MTIRQMADMVRDRNPVTAPPSATVAEASRKMRDRRVGAVLVVDAGARLVGIFTGRDAVARVPVVDKGQVVGIVSRGEFRGLEQARLDEETGLWERI